MSRSFQSPPRRVPSSRIPIPLVARLKFGEVQETLEQVMRPAPMPTPPVMANPISSRNALTAAGVRLLMLWRLEHHHAQHSDLRASVPWPTAEAHRSGDLAPNLLEILADCLGGWREFNTHGRIEPRVARSALATVVIRLAGQGKPEELYQGLDNDTLDDVLQVCRLPVPRELLNVQRADLAGHEGAEDARLDGRALLISTRTRLGEQDRARITAVLLDTRARGHLSEHIDLWLTRSARALRFCADDLLQVPLDQADDLWARTVR